MSEVHVPVLLNEVVDSFSNFLNEKNLVYYDGTYGRGGHFREIQKIYQPNTSFITDQDLFAIQQAEESLAKQVQDKSVHIFHQNFSEFAKSNTEKLNMILLDLGVSSPQLDQASRGFSFNKDGPLDMRMNLKSTLTAAEIVNEFSEEDLIEIFKVYGEVFTSGRVVRAIVKDRAIKPFTTTLQLAQMIERVDGWQKKGFHPATQYFMALRLVVNQELQSIEVAIPQLIHSLHDKGRLSIITFHSLEDRIIKNIFKNSADGFLVNKKVIVPTEEECKINPRARSAKLRVFQKGLMPEKPDKFALRRALKK